jgi:hypothetical protein
MKTIFLALVLLIGFNSFSQKEQKMDEKIKFIYKNTFVETDDYKLYITDAVATHAYTKFKFKVFNKTNDFLLIKVTDLFFTSEGKNLVCSEKKDMMISPNDEASKTIDFKGDDFRIDNFVIDIKAIYKASSAGKTLAMKNFVIPASTNQFDMGGLTCVMIDSKIKTDRSSAKFECAYNGDAAAIIDPYKCAAIMDNGKENANNKKYAPVLLSKGGKEDFFVMFDEVQGAGDMQKKGFTIKWNDSFKETKLLPIKGTQIKMVKESEKQ